ncbi:hypothetical protein A9J41_14105 [Laribacter hongkongensis]|nr:hypothetical protein [Laribacter hongkongensis]
MVALKKMEVSQLKKLFSSPRNLQLAMKLNRWRKLRLKMKFINFRSTQKNTQFRLRMPQQKLQIKNQNHQK